MTDNPIISVIVPVWNGEKTIAAAVESVLSQTLKELELILVDDGSTDGTAAICDACAAKDPRVRVIHQANGGVGTARNTGLDAARGTWIAWLDSDDTLMPEMLETLLAAAEQSGKNTAFCNHLKVFVNGNSKEHYRHLDHDCVFSREELVGLLLCRSIRGVCWGNIIRRELYEGLRFLTYKVAEDIYMTNALYERSNGGAYVARPLMRHYVTLGGLTKTMGLEEQTIYSEAIVHRCREGMTRWPQFSDTMLQKEAINCLVPLRNRICESSLRDYLRHMFRIHAICRLFRKNRVRILPSPCSRRFLLIYLCACSGTRAGALFSQYLERRWPKYGSDFLYLKKALKRLKKLDQDRKMNNQG